MSRRRFGLAFSTLLAAGALVAGVLPAAGAAPLAPVTPTPGGVRQSTASTAGQSTLAPTVRSAARHDTSRPLRRTARLNAGEYRRELRKESQAARRQATPRRVLPKAAHAAAPARGGSARVQRTAPASPGARMPDLQANFDGGANTDGVYPPDTNGDVGGDWYVQWVNVHLQIFNKTTGASVLGPIPGNAVWAGFGGPCESHNDGDPIARYDALANRWMLSQFAVFADDGNHQCIAISQTDDPTGAYYRYDFLISATDLNDYPHFGVWPDAYYMSTNLFDSTTFAFKGAGAVAFDRARMLSGQPATMVSFSLGDVDPRYGGQLPSDLDGAPPPPGAPNLFTEADDNAFGFPTDRINVWKFHVDWTDPSSSTFGEAGQPSFFLTTAPFDANMCGSDRSCIPQPGTSQGLDAISDRLMYRVQYRNFGDHQSLVLNHTVDSDGTDHAGIRWYELRSTDGGDSWAINQQGTYAPDGDNRWMASAAMDGSGDIAVGYSVSGSSTFPSVRLAGRLVDDPLGQLPQAESEMIAGSGAQTGDAGRWGDYSAMQVDSSDQCTFYYTQEYMATTGDTAWQTRIGSFSFPSCTAGPSGQVSGTVTGAASGDPVAGATVTAGDSSTTTGADGAYTLTLPAGTYDMTASAFGYNMDSANGVVVSANQTTTQTFELVLQQVVTVSGVVHDGSGHGWPLYAKVSVDGVPVDPVFTDPGNGSYSIDLPANQTYTFSVVAQYPGYLALAQDVVVFTDVTQDFELTVDQAACTAPGYTAHPHGTPQTFDGGTLPSGWSVTDRRGSGNVWTFDDPGGRGNKTGGDGGFAIVDSDNYGSGGAQNTSLVSPPLDFTGQSEPVVSFAEDYFNLGDTADVDVSIDGGTTWDTVLSQQIDARGPRTVSVPIPSAADQSDVRVRFHYYHAQFAWWWEIDDVLIGDRSCDPVRGGLVYGFVNDANTGQPLTGATVTSGNAPADTATSTATPDDPNLRDGFYWLFSSLTGVHPFTAKDGNYHGQTVSATVRHNWTREQNFSLAAGRLHVSRHHVRPTLELGTALTRRLRVSNTGTAPATVNIQETDGGFSILGADGSRPSGRSELGAPGAPLKLTHGRFLPDDTLKGTSVGSDNEGRYVDAAPWTSVSDYPTGIMDNALASNDGLVYSVGGVDAIGATPSANVYDPSTLAWSPIADMPQTRQKPGAAFIDGTLYVVGGWSSSGDPVAGTAVYDPASDSWSTAADMPVPVAAASVAVADGKIYVFGGCDTADNCGVTDSQVYDPASDTWSTLADYPEATSWESCGEISGTIYCAGGASEQSSSAHTYGYDPGSDTWTRLADLPIDLWSSYYTGANGLLLVSGGVTDGFNTLTNEGFAYDPSSDSWTSMPNANEALYRGGSTCGLYRVGGFSGGLPPESVSSVLPGFDQCGTTTDAAWVRERPTTMTLAPGESTTVRLRLDAGQVSQPGTYRASLALVEDTPYTVNPVHIRMRVTPPATWGKLFGTVDGRPCTGTESPLPGATVQVNGLGYHQTLQSSQDGGYATWLGSEVGRLEMIVAKDTFVPQTRRSRVYAGQATTESFTLDRTGC